MSLRCVGEGHISSIVFRRGLVDAAGEIALEPAGPYREPKRKVEKRLFSRAESRAKLATLGMRDVILDEVFARLDDPFTMPELQSLLHRLQSDPHGPQIHEEEMHQAQWLASCGSLVHNGLLVIPYGISDAATGFATIPLESLLARLC